MGQTSGTGESAEGGSRWAAPAATALLLLVVVLAGGTVVGRILNRGLPVARALPDLSPLSWLTDAGSALLFGVPGWYLATRRPRVAFGWLALAAAMGHALSGVGLEWVLRSELGGGDLPGLGLAWWLVAWGSLVEIPVLAAIFALFPSGHRPRGLLAWAAGAAVVSAAAGVGASSLALRPEVVADGRLRDVTNALGVGWGDTLSDALPAFFGPAMVTAAAVLFLRWRRAGDERRVLGWMTAVALPTAVLVPVAVLALPDALGVTIAQGSTLLVMAVLVAAALQGQVYGIELVLNRALVLTASTVCIAAVYGLGVGAFSLVGVRISGAPSLVAAVIAALSLAPARTRLQAGVNRMLFGDRDDPYAVVSRVASQLEAAGTADLLLPSFVEATASALRVPYVGIELTTPGRARTIDHGARPVEVESVPLVHGGEVLGALVVGRRSGERTTPAGEGRLLADLARQAAVAVAHVTLTENLQGSRARLLTVQEEERARVRRDLHDGLGPQLTGIALGLDVARGEVTLRAPDAAERIGRLQAEVRTAIDDVRRIARDLRPAGLDAAGLPGALRDLAARTAGADVEVIVDVTDPAPALAPEVEVALYRIAAEALNNVVRHAQARRCTVQLDVAEGVRLVVADDGRGMRSEGVEGVGLPSMRARAEEAGGSFRVEAVVPQGCRIIATFPVGSP